MPLITGSSFLRRAAAPLALAAAMALAGCGGSSGLGTDAPGRLVSQSALDGAATLPDAGEQFRILYQSTDGVTGKGTVQVSGAVFFPKTPRPAGGWPVVAWAHGTTGVGDACAPSANPRSARDTAYLGAWLREGFVVVATDYQGLGTPGPHPYLHTRAQAYSMLDAVRAALTLPGVANQVVLVGQSQGGGAAFGTAGLASSYAPDVKVLGTVATGTPYLVSSASPDQGYSDRIAPQVAYAMYTVVTAKLVQPGFDPSTVFLPAAMPALDASAEACVTPLFSRLVSEGRTERNTYQPGGQKRLFELVAPVTAYATLKLDQPVFMGIGGKDVDVPTAMQQALVRDACQDGSRIDAHVYSDMDHSGTVNASLQDSLPFVRNLLAGKAVPSTCGQ